MSAALALALLLAGPGAPAESPAGFYLGRLTSGTRTLEVGLALKASGAALTGEYYYFPAGEAIPLRGTAGAAGALTLEEGEEGKPVTGRWRGTVARGVFSGTWEAAKPGRKWSFKLVRSEDAADYFAGPPTTKNAGSTGPLTYRMARVPGNDNFPERQVPIITSFGDRAVSAAINATLVGLAHGAHCAQPPDDQEFEARVSFVGEDLFSVYATQSWMCGAPYPTSGADASVTFDLRTAKQIEFADLFRPDAANVDELLYAYQWEQARTTPAPPDSVDEFDCLDLYRKPPEDCTDCVAQRGPTHFHFSPEGLVVQDEMAHVIAACADVVTVPYAVLASAALPGSALARLATADTRRPVRYRIRTTAGREVVYTPPR